MAKNTGKVSRAEAEQNRSQDHEATERRNLAERLRQFAESQRMDFDAPDSAAMLDRAADALLAAERAKRPDREQERARVITLCGSSRFKDEFHAENQRLTMEGNVVISLGLFGHADMPDYDWTTDATDLKRTLDRLHFQKIDMADEVYVVAPGGYVGESTAREIAYAQSLGKVVSYSDPAVLALEPEAREDAEYFRDGDGDLWKFTDKGEWFHEEEPGKFRQVLSIDAEDQTLTPVGHAELAPAPEVTDAERAAALAAVLKLVDLHPRTVWDAIVNTALEASREVSRG